MPPGGSPDLTPPDTIVPDVAPGTKARGTEGKPPEVGEVQKAPRRSVIEASAKVVPRADGSFRLNRSVISHPEKIVGEPESVVLEDANREAVAADLAADKANIDKVYIGKEADRFINKTVGEKPSADVVAVTKKAQYYVYEAKGGDIARGLDQLEHTAEQLGPGRVQRQTLITKEKITTPGYAVNDDSELTYQGERVIVNGKPVYVKFTKQ